MSTAFCIHTTKWRVLSLVVTMVCFAGCENRPVSPELMPAVQPFGTPEQTALHVVEMRSNHMHLLDHKRDRTVYQGIRTRTHSLHACITCHVPKPTAQQTVKHSDPEHFCTTCHMQVAVKVDCFDCHADRPVMETAQVVQP